MARFDRILCVGLKGGEVDMSISMDAAELSEASAEEIRQMLAKAVERFDEFRRTWPRKPRPKKLYPHVIDGGRR